jgi:hypothetical protein
VSGLRLAAMALIAVAAEIAIAEDGFDFSGDIRTRYSGQTFPDNSLFNELAGSYAQDLISIPRLKFGYDAGPWDLRADYQVIAWYGDTIEYSRELPPGVQALSGRLPNDRTRLFDLTDVIYDEGKTALVQRLDRLSFGYSTRKAVVRVGRQAITWGNGMFYTPMDIFNPFDPAAVDTEYKSGDDMVYGQYLRDNGDDFQAVAVVRRNFVTENVEAADSSLAVKYHGVGGESEYDVLFAQHYDEPLLGFGGNRGFGGAVWRGDVTVALTEEDDAVASLVTSGSYSWTLGGKNVSGVLEYFFNGFGQSDGRYSAQDLAQNPELVERLVRGELFTLGRHYVTASALIEVTPLFLVTPNAFVNMSDGSALLQFVTQNDLAENLVLLGAVNLPVGPDGSEYGGIETEVPGQYLSQGIGFFAQLMWYF